MTRSLINKWCPNGCGKKVNYMKNRATCNDLKNYKCRLCEGRFTKAQIFNDEDEADEFDDFK